MQGSLVSLRAVTKEDSCHYFKWINDKSLVLNNANYKPVSEYEHQNWFDRAFLNQDVRIFSIVVNSNNQLIGSCSLRHINTIHRNAELQIRIGELDYQNKGLGSEAIQLLVDYGFNHLNLIRISLQVFANNHRAIRAYEKCDFQREGLLRKAAYIDGRYIDIVMMSILNESH